jgi:geranylgeranyl pyrophosphate synthase
MIARASKDAFAQRLDHYRKKVDLKLAEILGSDAHIPERLRAAMQYSVLGGGKRVRPLLVYASGELCGVSEDTLDTIAAAVELVHAYSLVHDDLPAMDDDDLRRGRPDHASPIRRGYRDPRGRRAPSARVRDPVRRCGPHRAAARADQDRSVARARPPARRAWWAAKRSTSRPEGKRLDERALEDIHRRKTGQLIRASIMMPSELGELTDGSAPTSTCSRATSGSSSRFATTCSRSSKDTATLGKDAGSDANNDKSTYPSTLGVDGARRRAAETQKRAIDALQTLGDDSQALLWLSDFILTRSH